jgi:glycosyltransferase involved in cell wall biosynthesis
MASSAARRPPCGACRALEAHGHEVILFVRRTEDILSRPLGKVRALVSGIRNPEVGRDFARLLARRRPDVVQVQNIYPAISSIVFQVAREAGVPVVLRCSNYRLFCPTGLLMAKTAAGVCERCIGGREFWCVLRNCEGSIPKSIGYALRTAYNRARGTITRNTTMYYTPSRFLRGKLVGWGIPGERMTVVPTPVVDASGRVPSSASGEYVAYAGRVGPEKGVDVLVRAAASLRDVPFRVAGEVSELARDVVDEAPPNVTWLGQLTRQQLRRFYAKARIVAVPSTCYETFPNVALEAMIHARPVIGSRIGGIPEIVDDGTTGLLFESGDGAELADEVRRLWDRPEQCAAMGEAGRDKALREYSPERFYARLMAVYDSAIRLAGSAPSEDPTLASGGCVEP